VGGQLFIDNPANSRVEGKVADPGSGLKKAEDEPQTGLPYVCYWSCTARLGFFAAPGMHGTIHTLAFWDVAIFTRG
jgi:hypothetical protein